MIDEVSVERVRLPRTLKVRVMWNASRWRRSTLPTVGASRWNCRGSPVRLDADGYVIEAARSAPVHGFRCRRWSAIAGGHGLECLSIAAGSSRRVAAGAGGVAIDRRVRPFADLAGLVDLRRVDVSQAGRGRGDDGAGWRNCFWSGKFGATIGALAEKSTIWE